jgi:ribosomal protein L19
VAAVTESQLAALDPTGERKALFDYRRNPRSVKVGDILRVTFKNGDPFSGVCLSIRLRGVDTSFLLRNELTRVGVEMSVKVFSPNVESVEIVQRAEKRKRRARLYYMRYVLGLWPQFYSLFHRCMNWLTNLISPSTESLDTTCGALRISFRTTSDRSLLLPAREEDREDEDEESGDRGPLCIWGSAFGDCIITYTCIWHLTFTDLFIVTSDKDQYRVCFWKKRKGITVIIDLSAVLYIERYYFCLAGFVR